MVSTLSGNIENCEPRNEENSEIPAVKSVWNPPTPLIKKLEDVIFMSALFSTPS